MGEVSDVATDTHDEGDVVCLEKVNDLLGACEPSVKDEQRFLFLISEHAKCQSIDFQREVLNDSIMTGISQIYQGGNNNQEIAGVAK